VSALVENCGLILTEPVVFSFCVLSLQNTSEDFVTSYFLTVDADELVLKRVTYLKWNNIVYSLVIIVTSAIHSQYKVNGNAEIHGRDERYRKMLTSTGMGVGRAGRG